MTARSALLLAGALLAAGCAGTATPPPPAFVHGPERREEPGLVAPGPRAFPAEWQGKDLGLPELFRLADANSPAIEAARHRRDAALGAALQAGLYPNPTLETAIRDARTSSPSSSEMNTFGGIAQPIIVGGRRGRAMEAADALAEAAEQDLEDERCRVLAEVYAAYVDILYFQAATELNRALLAEADDLVARARTPADRARASIQAEERALEVVRLSAEAVYATDRLERYLGGVRPVPDQIRGQLVRGIVPEALAVQAHEAVDAHPEVLAAEARAAAAERAARQARAEVVPDITVRAGIGHNGRRDESFAEAGISVPIPAWNRNQGRIAEADGEQAAAEQAVREARDRLASEFRIVVQQVNEWHTLSGEYGRLIAPESRRAHHEAREAYAAGGPFLEVLDTQRDWFRAANQELYFRWRLNQSYAELWRLRGGPAEAFHRDP